MLIKSVSYRKRQSHCLYYISNVSAEEITLRILWFEQKHLGDRPYFLSVSHGSNACSIIN